MKGYNDDTRRIQEMLDNNDGRVYLCGGIYEITCPLKIHDDTLLTLSHKAVMRLSDKANCAIIENDGLAEKINKNITIEGGIWDGNNKNQVRAPLETRFKLTKFEDDYYYGILMRFIGVNDFKMRDMTIKDPESYAMQISLADRFTIERITFDYNLLRSNMDGVHIQGPAYNGRIQDIKGTTNDDLVALNCDDIYACEITSGDIENIIIDGLYSDNGYTAVRLLSCGHALRNVQINNIFGNYRYYAVSFTHHSVHPGAPIWMDNVSVNGVFASKPTVILDSENTFSPNT